jgi:hypothetical protein
MISRPIPPDPKISSTNPDNLPGRDRSTQSLKIYRKNEVTVFLESEIKPKSMKTKYIFFIGTLFSLSLGEVSGQAPQKTIKKDPKFHVLLDYHYNLGLATKQQWQSYDLSKRGHSLHLTALYDFTSRIAAGIGIGADRYTHPDFNTIPVYATFRYKPVSNIPQGYIYTNLGYGCFSNEAITSGWMWDLGIGYTKMFRRHFGLNFQIGYNLKEFADIPFYEYNINTENITYLGTINDLRHSLSIGIGLVF